MVHTLTSPVGIDFMIQRLQNMLYTELCDLWSMSDGGSMVYDAYGRAYRLQKDYGIVPECFAGGTDYLEVLFDDTKAALSFFDVGDTITVEKPYSNTARVSVYFQINLNKVKPGTQRLDEQARLDVINLIELNGFGFIVKSVAIAEREVFKNYNGYRKKQGTKYVDMHPYHCFRIDMEVPNYTNQTYCNAKS